ncbi:MAG: hypothetical protein L6R39_003505 [Caloplaca ligustica]|nr:MAG: hypothetical protein L6R39_003505 [Caloplaca ligustica]
MDNYDEYSDDDFHEPDIDLEIPERAKLARLRETVRRDIVAHRAAAEVEVKDSPRSRSIDMHAIPTNTSSTTITTTKPAAHDAAILGDPFPCRINKFQCTECTSDEQLL